MEDSGVWIGMGLKPYKNPNLSGGWVRKMLTLRKDGVLEIPRCYFSGTGARDEHISSLSCRQRRKLLSLDRKSVV